MTKHSENNKHDTCDNNVLANRLLKFNIWDIDRQQYFHDVLSLEKDKILQWATLEKRTSKNVIWLQYSDFKDFNGKEIIEGDIFIFQYTLDGTQKRTKVVSFDKEVGAWYLGGDLLSTVLVEQNNDDWKREKNYKINEKQYLIYSGNIFQNPELLQTTS